MIRDIRYYTNRINLLSGRNKENGKIIAKLKRKIQALKLKEG